MKILNVKIALQPALILLTILTFSACGTWKMPDQIPGSYSGKERIIVRYEENGQFIFYEDSVFVSLSISSNQQVTGTVGNAVFEGCEVYQNRGWFSRKLHIKTDFLIRGRLNGTTFSRDSILQKNISIPFNIENDELKGSLFLKTKRESLPIISILKLNKKEGNKIRIP